MTRIGYQIPNFTYPGAGPDTLFDVVAQQARAEQRLGHRETIGIVLDLDVEIGRAHV